MAEFLIAMAGAILAVVAVGLIRVLRGPSDADRMMAAQLLGTGSVAALLLLATGARAAAIVDAAVILTLLAAFAVAAFVSGVPDSDPAAPLRRHPL
jgi:multicomponent Na+:H+ antiporter subunit F